jgi:V/A-type H+/Na+-transporting ATPase subunit D
MAIKFQYNKTSLQALSKQLDIRVRTLPTIKNKESALRIEVKKAKDKYTEYDTQLLNAIEKYRNLAALWSEYDHSLLRIKEIETSVKKIAGVPTVNLENIVFSRKEYALVNQPDWIPAGIELLKELVTLEVQKHLWYEKMELLNYARRKTTQKVNLYEKVQIPGYEDAIRKIKRFLEDEENLSKSAQKIVKNRQSVAI